MIKKMLISLIPILLFLGCAGTNPDVQKHRNMAEEAMMAGDSRVAISHIDYAVAACENDTSCERDIYRWMLDFATAHNNDVFRAKAYERLALSYLEPSSEGNMVEAKRIAAEYLRWADSLRAARGDLFPLTDALILEASVFRLDRPDSAIDFITQVLKLGSGFERTELPKQLRIAIGRGKALIDGLNAEMIARFEAGKRGEDAIANLTYAFRAAAAFGKADIASDSAALLAELYDKKGDHESASRWTAEALKWKGNSIHEKSGE